MSFNAIRENKILAKISEFTVSVWTSALIMARDGALCIKALSRNTAQGLRYSFYISSDGPCSNPFYLHSTKGGYTIEGVTATRYFSPLWGKNELASFSCIKTISAPY